VSVNVYMCVCVCPQYVFFQSIREYVSDLIGFLTEKAPIIEEALDELKDLCRDRAVTAHTIRQAHVDDLIVRAFGSQAVRAMDMEEDGRERVDEFGRDQRAVDDDARHKRAAARAKRRARYHVPNTTTSTALTDECVYEGQSSDDEDEELSHLSRKLQQQREVCTPICPCIHTSNCISIVSVCPLARSMRAAASRLASCVVLS
jgi:hypothetical protein